MLFRSLSFFKCLLCYRLLLFIPLTASSQILTTQDIVENFKTSDTSQSAEFGKALIDLNSNLNETVFKQRVKEIRDYLRRNSDVRVQLRLFLYERFAYIKMNVADKESSLANYLKVIKLAGLFGDEQLLSEVYSRCADLFPPSQKLYYLLKCIEIRERIGVNHFSDITANYYSASVLMYQITDYKSSASYAAKCLSLYREKAIKDFLFQYILVADIAGASYLKINKPDSAIYYYTHIDSLITDRIAHPDKYKSPMTSEVLQIWKGVIKGGLARAYMLQSKYDIAYALLIQNLESSIKFNQWDNVAEIQNALAEIDELRNNTALALKRYLNAYDLTLKGNKLPIQIAAVQGIAAIFASLKQYDKAYFYHAKYFELKNKLDEQINQSRLDLVKTQVDFEQSQKELLQSKNSLINQKRIRNSILVTIGLLTVVALLLYNRKRLQMNLQNEKAEREKQRAVAEMAYAQQQIDFVVRNIAEKNKLISQLKSQVNIADNLEVISTLTDFTILTDQDWRKFKMSFETINPNYLDRLKQKMPNVTQGEQRIIFLAKLGFSTKEMANATGVSSETIRSVISRMRKKHNLDTDIHTFADEV